MDVANKFFTLFLNQVSYTEWHTSGMDNEGKLKEEEGGEKDEWDDGEGGDDVSSVFLF